MPRRQTNRNADHPELGLPEVRPLWDTHDLFSDHYLKERLPQNTWWPSDEDVRPLWEFCRHLYNKRYIGCAKGPESETRQELLNKILERLGYAWTDNLSLPESALEPDYILFSDDAAKERVMGKSVTERYQAAVAVLEAKKVNTPLSRKSRSQQRYPHQQIRQYLDEAQVFSWGILTNGNEWRLYCRQTRPSYYFALNFEVAIQGIESFKYFAALFCPAAFIKDAQGKCRLDVVRESAVAAQSALEEDLRQRVFTLVEILANGFMEYEANEIPSTPEGYRRLYENCLILLYRLLFILYAEGRGLLPVEPRSRRYYKDLSLARLAGPLRSFREYGSHTRTRLYEDIRELCHLVNGTDQRKNREYSVPRYNGGLFDPDRHSQLEQWRICDARLAEVLRGLIFTRPSRVADLSQGIIVYKTKQDREKAFLGAEPRGPEWMPSAGGSDLGRYVLVPDGTFVKYGRWLWCPRDPKYFTSEKLLFQRIRNPALARKLVFAYDPYGVFNRHTLSNLIALPGSELSLMFLLAILNSRLLNALYGAQFADVEIRIANVRSLPIPRVDFGMRETDRRRLFMQIESMFEAGVRAGAHPQLLSFVEKQLTAGRTDVIHDLLAFLAERMTAMNREKHETAHGFLTDLKDFHGVDAHALKPKTKLDTFWTLETADVFAHLRKNAKTLAAQGVHLKDEDQEKIRTRFQAAKDRILPLEARISFTDDLIDQIVYKLYGLGPEEIAIVEGRS